MILIHQVKSFTFLIIIIITIKYFSRRIGPSSYDIKSQPYKPKAEHPSANFVSKTAREIIIEVIYSQ